MRTHAELSHIFPNQTALEILLFFLFHPKERIHLARIVHATDKALIQVQRALKRLVEIGLVLKHTRIGKAYYQANPSHIAYEEVQRLALKAKMLNPLFKKEFSNLEKKINYGFIYGSVAKGTNTETSDIDVFIVGNIRYENLGSFFYNIGCQLVREVNPIIFSKEQIKAEIQNQNSFIKDVLNGPKIWLFGNKYEFEQISKEWLSHKP